MYGTWTPVEDGLPKQLEHVLFLTKKGGIHKGFLNLRETWIIENAEGLTTAFIRDSEDVIGWMELPGKDADWRKAGREMPREDSRVLAMDWTNKVYIVYVCKNVWTIQNVPGSKSTFCIWPKDESLWMPLPKGL